jgi:hypothetical protein
MNDELKREYFLRKYAKLDKNKVIKSNISHLERILKPKKKLSDEQLKMLADLMYEKGEYYVSVNSNEEASTTPGTVACE